MERLRKLKPSFHSIGSYYCRTRITPIAADSYVGERFFRADQVPNAAESFVGERFDKCKLHLPLIHQNLAKSCSYASSSCVRPTFSPKLAPNPFSSGSKRFFSRGNTGEEEEEDLIGLLACSLLLVVMAAVAGKLSSVMETEVPYTHRHIHFPVSNDDRKLGAEMLKKKKELEFKGAILPSTHPLSVKVCLILKQLLDALHRDLGLDDTPRVSYHGLDYTYQEEITAFGVTENKREIREGRRDKSQLRAMDWQVVVVDKNEKEAYTLGGGIIVVSSGLLNQHSDVWIAAVLAHGVGHIVARHVTEFLRFTCGPASYDGIGSTTSSTYQRIEKEASYIGSQLMASAGYDPLLYKNLEINYSECEANGPISLEETYTTHVARSVYRQKIKPVVPY